MAQNDDGGKKQGGSGGAIFLVVVVLAAMAFVGDSDSPLDRMADLVIIVTWVMAIGLLIFVIFFILAYCMQTAMSDLYESLMDDLENSPLRDKIEHYKAKFDQLMGRTAKSEMNRPRAGNQDRERDIAQSPDKEVLKSKPKPKPKLKPKPRRPKTKEELERELEKQLEEDVLAMMDEENNKRGR